ncbi:hypothetical protein Tco_0903297 [Tanacetum coccineum]
MPIALSTGLFCKRTMAPQVGWMSSTQAGPDGTFPKRLGVELSRRKASCTFDLTYVSHREQISGKLASGAHDKEGTRADVSAPHWSANDWPTPEGTKILPADQIKRLLWFLLL